MGKKLQNLILLDYVTQRTVNSQVTLQTLNPFASVRKVYMSKTLGMYKSTKPCENTLRGMSSCAGSKTYPNCVCVVITLIF